MPFLDWVTPTQDPINNDENVAQKSLNHRGSKGGLFLVPQDVNKTKINQRSCCNSLFGSSFMIEDLHDKLVSCWFPVSVVRSQFHYILIQNAEHLLLRETYETNGVRCPMMNNNWGLTNTKMYFTNQQYH